MTFDSALPHSALYHGGNGGASFNSSGRSSNCDDGDMQSDISLEEDVNDLNQKVRKTSFFYFWGHTFSVHSAMAEGSFNLCQKNSLIHGVNDVFAYKEGGKKMIKLSAH